MRKALTLARREYKASVKTKGFILGLIIAPVFMSGSAIAMALLKDRVDTRDRVVAVVDHSGVVAEGLAAAAEQRNAQETFDKETGEKIKPSYVIEIVEPQSADLDSQRLALSDRVRAGEIHAFLEVGPDVLHPAREGADAGMAYYAKNAAGLYVEAVLAHLDTVASEEQLPQAAALIDAVIDGGLSMSTEAKEQLCMLGAYWNKEFLKAPENRLGSSSDIEQVNGTILAADGHGLAVGRECHVVNHCPQGARPASRVAFQPPPKCPGS